MYSSCLKVKSIQCHTKTKKVLRIKSHESFFILAACSGHDAVERVFPFIYSFFLKISIPVLSS